jgi:16S rRNA (uracil1498-N3)-methyltransferase
MSSPPRFYAPPAGWNIAEGTVVLDASESRHCVGVLRRGVGEMVRVFDGQGRQAAAVIRAADRQQVSLGIKSIDEAPDRGRFALAVAIPKGKTIDWIIEKAVELGAGEIVPLITQRTIVRVDPRERAARQQKWQRVALEACKQCGQNWLPQVTRPLDWPAFIAGYAANGFDLPLVGSLQPDARPLREVVGAFISAHNRRPATACLIVGPEGDLTVDEYTLAHRRGWHATSFGAGILRVETAALFGLSILRYEIENRG